MCSFPSSRAVQTSFPPLSDPFLKLDPRLCNILLRHCICIMYRKHRIRRKAVGTTFCFNAKNAATNTKCVLKCSEVHNRLRRPQVDRCWHWFGWWGWCVAQWLKLTIIGTWKFATKSNTCILFERLHYNHMLSITKGPNKCP
jgi:hypothetical protein